MEKLISMDIREVIWAVSFDSLLELDPYVNVNDVVGYDPN